MVMTGCSASGASGGKAFEDMSGEEHLACAVDIAAYASLLESGMLPLDRGRPDDFAVAVAWHHNAYAMPLGEGDAYALILRERDALLGTDTPEAIAARAVACLDAVPSRR